MRDLNHARAQVRFLRALVDLQSQHIRSYRLATFSLMDRLNRRQRQEAEPEIQMFNCRQQDLFRKEFQLLLALDSLEKA